MKNNILIFFMMLLYMSISGFAVAKENCVSTNKKHVKIEAWLSKKFEKEYWNIRDEFREMGKTKVGLFIYPADNPSRVVAIGRCVPVYLAQYFLKKADKYSLGTTHLVNQGFVSSHWTGIGTSMFSENSMNPITPQQLSRLMDETLDTESFQQIYRSFTVQKEKVSGFGLILDNPKLLSKTQ
jgi:hypothetical protein